MTYQVHTKYVYLLLILTALAFTACASSNKAEEQALTQKIQAQPVVETPDEIATRAAETFSNAPGLTEAQRQKLMAIYSHTYSESMALRKEIGQSKSLLFKTISQADYSSKEVNRIKKRITDLDKTRLALMFKALEDVQTVVGRGSDKEKIYQHLHEIESIHGADRSKTN